jgi:hypothetical protein
MIMTVVVVEPLTASELEALTIDELQVIAAGDENAGTFAVRCNVISARAQLACMGVELGASPEVKDALIGFAPRAAADAEWADPYWSIVALGSVIEQSDDDGKGEQPHVLDNPPKRTA